LAAGRPCCTLRRRAAARSSDRAIHVEHDVARMGEVLLHELPRLRRFAADDRAGDEPVVHAHPPPGRGHVGHPAADLEHWVAHGIEDDPEQLVMGDIRDDAARARRTSLTRSPSARRTALDGLSCLVAPGRAAAGRGSGLGSSGRPRSSGGRASPPGRDPARAHRSPRGSVRARDALVSASPGLRVAVRRISTCLPRIEPIRDHEDRVLVALAIFMWARAVDCARQELNARTPPHMS
jgi:hypothetical protein